MNSGQSLFVNSLLGVDEWGLTDSYNENSLFAYPNPIYKLKQPNPLMNKPKELPTSVIVDVDLADYDGDVCIHCDIEINVKRKGVIHKLNKSVILF